MAEALICCTCCPPLSQTREDLLVAARIATEVNPLNAPGISSLNAIAEETPSIEMLAALTTKYWRTGSVRLTVGFLDNPSPDLRRRILANMNAWARTANILFVESSTDAQVRIARDPGNRYGLYWSGLGTDILNRGYFSANEPTMNLGGFTDSTSERTMIRVVRHEAGHTLGFPHEHLRREIIERIDNNKAFAYLYLWVRKFLAVTSVMVGLKSTYKVMARSMAGHIITFYVRSPSFW